MFFELPLHATCYFALGRGFRFILNLCKANGVTGHILERGKRSHGWGNGGARIQSLGVRFQERPLPQCAFFSLLLIFSNIYSTSLAFLLISFSSWPDSQEYGVKIHTCRCQATTWGGKWACQWLFASGMDSWKTALSLCWLWHKLLSLEKSVSPPGIFLI